MINHKHREWWISSLFQQSLRAAGDHYQARARKEYDLTTALLFIKHDFPCESPLEGAFVAWWVALTLADLKPYHIEAQHTVSAGGDTYRLDLVVKPSDHAPLVETPPKIAIEMDGHAFHEKTLEQVSRRNKRDRALQQDGWTVFHFSFSEFMSDPVKCVSEVLEFADRAYATGGASGAHS